mmetsp:Transcript_10905/g.37057  ORF Transcript_10905/g.37057 Transcript_10905/m.37057 type:complete len:245 (-) Transcript_10905:1637-2371(-)
MTATLSSSELPTPRSPSSAESTTQAVLHDDPRASAGSSRVLAHPKPRRTTILAAGHPSPAAAARQTASTPARSASAPARKPAPQRKAAHDNNEDGRPQRLILGHQARSGQPGLRGFRGFRGFQLALPAGHHLQGQGALALRAAPHPALEQARRRLEFFTSATSTSGFNIPSPDLEAPLHCTCTGTRRCSIDSDISMSEFTLLPIDTVAIEEEKSYDKAKTIADPTNNLLKAHSLSETNKRSSPV